MVPVKKEDLRKLVTDTTVEIYEELTPQLVKLIQDTKKNTELTEGQKQDEISLHMMGYVWTPARRAAGSWPGGSCSCGCGGR